jgi:hypothetical protein
MEELDAKALAPLLGVGPKTAQRRLAEWYRAAPGTAPATLLRPRPGRAGRPRYVTTRAELARHLPEIDDA